MADVITQSFAPKFNGDNPEQWVSKIQTFFDSLMIPEDERLRRVELALEGDAHEWYRWMKSNNLLLHDWHDLLRKIVSCFEPSHEFVDHRDEMNKLTQKGTVAEFQAEYARVINKVVTGISEDQLIMFFVQGLKSHLKRDVQLAKPRTISEAFSLAKYYEAGHEELIRASQIMSQYIDFNRSDRIWIPNPTNQPVPALGLLTSPSQCLNTGRGVKRLSPAEFQERRSKGLCFKCNKKFHPKHQCTPSFP